MSTSGQQVVFISLNDQKHSFIELTLLDLFAYNISTLN